MINMKIFNYFRLKHDAYKQIEKINSEIGSNSISEDQKKALKDSQTNLSIQKEKIEKFLKSKQGRFFKRFYKKLGISPINKLEHIISNIEEVIQPKKPIKPKPTPQVDPKLSSEVESTTLPTLKPIPADPNSAVTKASQQRFKAKPKSKIDRKITEADHKSKGQSFETASPPKLEEISKTARRVLPPAPKSVMTQEELRNHAKCYGWKTANLMKLRSICENYPGLSASVPEFEGLEHVAILNHIHQFYPAFESDWEQFKIAFENSGHSLDACKELIERIQAGIYAAFKEHLISGSQIEKMCNTRAPLMVRSTGREDDPGEKEDGSDAVSNPGGNLSLANVAPSAEKISESIGRVVASYFSLKSLGQRQEMKDDITADPFLPVLLQVMVDERSEKSIPVSGVMYTREPDLLTPGVIQIEAAPGHAEGVVTGSNPSDLFYVQSGIVHQLVQEKPSRLVPDEASGLKSDRNPKNLVLSPSLSQKEARKLALIGMAVEKSYENRPMDVEWSYNPKTGKFYLFQARTFKPSTASEYSHIDPQKLRECEEIHSVSVVVAAQGIKAMHLNRENTLVVESAKAAIALSAKNPQIKTVIIRDFVRKNSHEAGYFRSLGISVINPGKENYRKIEEAIKSNSLLIDVGEGIVATVPKGRSVEEFVVSGLRRHLAPKMESAPAPVSRRKFIEELKNSAQEANSQEIRRKVLLMPGANRMDQYLNAFEEAATDNERAYILSKVLEITHKSMRNVPTLPAQQFFNKVVANAHHAWIMRSSGDLEKKFAMNWLRASLVRERVYDVFESDTLYSLLGENAEREILAASASKQTDSGLLDVFLRSGKFLISQEDRRHWKQFCERLNEDQLQQLASVFALLGPRVVELWINFGFLEAYAASRGDANNCLNAILKQIEGPFVAQTLAMVKKSKECVAKIKLRGSDLDDPATYQEVKDLLRQELHPIAKQCAELIKNNPSSKLGFALCSQALNEMVAVYDDCIKALSGSPMYAEKEQLKAIRFIELLEGYLEIAQHFICEEVLLDRDLNKQSRVLIDWLQKNLERARKLADSPQAVEQLFIPASDFSVQLISLGSNCLTPERISPRIVPLELIFSVIHQSLLTTSQTIAYRGGVSLDTLPTEMRLVSNAILKLYTGATANRSKYVALQSVDVNYPMITATFNCPLNNHSAKFSVIGELGRDGKLTRLTFEGIVIAPDNGMDAARSIELGMYLFSALTEGKTPSDSYRPELTYSGVKFYWDIPLDDLDSFSSKASKHLQEAIAHLQSSVYRPLKFDTTNLISFLKREPRFVSLIVNSDKCDKEARKMILEEMENQLSEPSLENARDILEMGSYFLNNCRSSTDLNPVIDIIIEHDEFWSGSSSEWKAKIFFQSFLKKRTLTSEQTQKLKQRLPNTF